VYTDIESLLDVHHDLIQQPEPETVTCAEPGCDREIESTDDESAYCEDHRDGPEKVDCRECGEPFDKSELNDNGRCPDCAHEEWSSATSQMAASRAFNEVRTGAISKASSGSTPGVSQVTVEVVGEDRLSKGSFVAEREPFTSRIEDVSVRMDYDVQTSAGTKYSAEYSGCLDEFSQVVNQPEPFGERVDTTLKFRVNLEETEPLTDEEDDVLAELREALGQTNIDVKVDAQGPTEAPTEITK
jgi:hypothetical protein